MAALVDARELQDLSFRCLEGCGFCCTFQPEVSTRELALLRKRFAPQPVRVGVDDGRAYLQLQNKCGGCTLLERRACTAYDLRPAHCRYFPFHVHFGEEPQIHVNHTCRGVEAAPGADLAAAYDAQVTQVARAEDWAEHERLARDAYATFQRKARRADAWGDARATATRALDDAGDTLVTSAWVERACADAGEPATAMDAWSDARAAFEEPDVARRPFYLAPDLRWITFSHESDDELGVWEMDERGELARLRTVDGLAAWRDPPATAAPGLAAYVRRLAARGAFVGGVYALVDDSEYALTVENATLLRLAEIAADVALRARILDAMGTPAADLAHETARFYDSTFLDAPTIGGWL